MAVTAQWERPDGRRQVSVTAPLFVDLEGHRVRVRDWSLAGFTLEGSACTWSVCSQHSVKVTLPFQGFEVSFGADVRVLDRPSEDNSPAGDNSIVVDYVSLGSRERELLRHFLDELVSGSMSDARDTIMRIDVPVAPVSTAVPSRGEARTGDHAAVRRMRAHPAVMLAAYSTLGALVFGYLGYLVYTNAFRLEVEAAMLSSPSETMAAQGDGFVTWASVRPGDTVKSGDVLATVFDNALEREIELSEITVREREARFSLLQRRVLDELTRLQSAVDGASPAGSKIRLEVESLRARVQANEQELRRVMARPRDAQTAMRVDEAKKKLLANQKALEGKQVDMRSRLEREILSPGTRTNAAGQTAFREMTVLEAQMAQAEQDYEFAQLRHQAIIAHRNRLAVRSPFDGVLVALPHSDRASVRKGETIAIVEQSGAPLVMATMSQAEALRVGLGDTARLYVPARGEYMTAHVTHIDRWVDGARDRARPYSDGSSAKPAKTTSARVTLTLDRPDLVQSRQDYANGLPVVVQFKRRWTSTVAQASSGERGADRATRATAENGASSVLIPPVFVQPVTTAVVAPATK
jgi:multidrug resistance efflux pump